jgi:rubrerythrin
MNTNENLTSLEALGIAIRSEIDSQNVYKDLAELCEDDLLKERFLNLAQEEKKHQLIFEKMYSDMFPEVDLVLPASQLPSKAIDTECRKKMGLKDVLMVAIEEEKRMHNFYENFAMNVKDLSGKRMFRFIADMEYKHRLILQAEYEIIEKYPKYWGETGNWDVESRMKSEKIKRE